MRAVLLADPGHARVASFRQEYATRDAGPLTVVSAAEWLENPECLLQQLQAPCWLKLEALGESRQVQELLASRAAQERGQPATRPLLHGEIAPHDLGFHGLAQALAGLEAELKKRPWVQCLNSPSAILAVSDKWSCQQRLQALDIPIPPLLGRISGFAELDHIMQSQGAKRIFIKPRYGSSASGVIALETDGRGRLQATTSIEYQDEHSPLFNSLRVRRYQGDTVVKLVNLLASRIEVYAEKWIPKPSHQGQSVDWRVVAIGQQCQHRVARISRSPLTNLHLGNQRGKAEDLLSPEQTEALESMTARVAASFAESRILGIDMIVARRGIHVLELNAFGDWLPRLLWQQKTVHEAEIDWMLGQQ